MESRVPWGLVISGTAIFSSLYLFSVGLATQVDARLAIPVAGPFVAETSDDPMARALAWLGLALVGVGQITGAALLTSGLVVRYEEVVPAPGPGVSLMPAPGGLALGGWF